MISFIVPIYNAEHYLIACIESLLRQTERDLQIILVDDGSTDNSLTIARDYANKDTRIEVLPQKHKGQSAARNYGLSHAKGEYIAFVDADDALERDWCEKHLAAIDQVDYVQSGYKRIDSNKQIIKDKLPLHRYQFTSPCMRLYRRQAIENMLFAENYIYEDVLFSSELWLKNLKYRFIPYTGYLYTLNPKSTTYSSHPEAQKKVLTALHNKLKGTSLKGKCILWYTIIRLKLYFLLQ